LLLWAYDWLKDAFVPRRDHGGGGRGIQGNLGKLSRIPRHDIPFSVSYRQTKMRVSRLTSAAMGLLMFAHANEHKLENSRKKAAMHHLFENHVEKHRSANSPRLHVLGPGRYRVRRGSCSGSDCLDTGRAGSSAAAQPSVPADAALTTFPWEALAPADARRAPVTRIAAFVISLFFNAAIVDMFSEWPATLGAGFRRNIKGRNALARWPPILARASRQTPG
jgi:hypothetical protein